LDTQPREHTYQAGSQLLILIINLTFRLKRDCYFCDIILLLFSGYMYNKYATDMQFFIYCEAGMIALLGLVQYLLLSAKGKFVSQTVVEITFSKETITIKTALFDGPLWFKKTSADVTLSRTGLVINKATNPYPGIFKDAKHLYRLQHHGNDIYLMPDYFAVRMEEELMG